MSENKKGRRWDGRSRISTQKYKDNYNEIFKKEKTNTKNDPKPRNSIEKSHVGANLQVNAEIVNGHMSTLFTPNCSASIFMDQLYL